MAFSLEFAKLLFGLAIMFFHRPIADFVLQQEESLVAVFRQRGLPMPSAPSTETIRNVYFIIGLFVVGFQLTRIWLLHSGHIL